MTNIKMVNETENHDLLVKVNRVRKQRNKTAVLPVVFIVLPYNSSDKCRKGF